MKQLILSLSAALLTIFSILANFGTYSEGTAPSGIGIILTFLFLIGWIVLIGFSIHQYQSVLLFLFALFWFLAFLSIAITAFILAYGAPEPNWLKIFDIIFFSPMYGLRDFLSFFATLCTAGGISVFFSILCFLCMRRKSDSRYVNHRKKKEHPQE